MKISESSGKLLETHHLVYSEMMSWMLGQGIFIIKFEINNSIVLAQSSMMILTKNSKMGSKNAKRPIKPSKTRPEIISTGFWLFSDIDVFIFKD